ncbi:AhpC/TSA family protein [Chitinophaga lutea]|uniref:AhpC/TSA family protein n=1 Tax=Chitinophaga lutea TaxID=2488634 RepID=A0A3N4PWK9_9BACT|nr:TlpA disulfide reductase family protein [Chitinophaga lutea]RPE13072.1 AhpC/TSA family protein [Chitinophaga lutea]
MRQLLFLIIALAGNFNTRAQDGYVLQGQADTALNGQYIHLYGIDWSDLNPKIADSVQITNGRFQFKGKLNTPGLLISLYLKGNRFAFTQLYIQNNKMTVQLKGTHWYKRENSLLSNAPYNDDWRSLKTAREKADYNLGFLRHQMDSIQRARPDTTLADMAERGKVLERQVVLVEKQWVREHPASYISLITLAYSLFRKLEIDELRGLYGGLPTALQRSVEGVALKERIAHRAAIQVGNMAPEFAVKDTSGNIFRLSDARGKYVLLDFWASWCGPCLEQVPVLKKFHELNKDRNLKIIGISLDTDSSRWLAAIRQHDLNWLHVSDLQGWKSATGKLYNVQAIPQNILIDPQGKIAAIDIDLSKYSL